MGVSALRHQQPHWEIWSRDEKNAMFPTGPTETSMIWSRTGHANVPMILPKGAWAPQQGLIGPDNPQQASNRPYEVPSSKSWPWGLEQEQSRPNRAEAPNFAEVAQVHGYGRQTPRRPPGGAESLSWDIAGSEE